MNSNLKIAENPINLRFATEWEISSAKLILENKDLPEYILASDTAFDGKTALYRGINRDGEIDSCGWIGNIA